ncbi:ABC transporter permease [Sulfidibacter corallicola]|uniref:ABC transporter permease n=1 Tax=Sulfidibacter corallicola TaxID=2818388 RepID=A0A8A4TM17_SULCO|nr:ABC transporter permease [Sulfidibacter corallicola]QTD50507.1 ABC transporter permease [Sulfidibacter corallicola]
MIKRFSWTATTTWLVLLFLHLPVAVLIAYSFNASRYGGRWLGFSFKWYERLFRDDEIWRALGYSVAIGLAATLLSLILGVSGALALHRARYRLRGLHFSLLYLPLAVPDILMGISLLLFFVLLQVPLGVLTIVAAHTSFCVSYVCMVVLGRLQTFDFTSIEAARDLGATPWQAARLVLLPRLVPAMVSGGLLAFTLSMDDFVITFFVSGPGSTTLPLRIYSMIKHGSPPLINALSTLLIVFTAAVIAVAQRFTKEVPRT